MDRNPEIHQKETKSEERFGKDAQQTERDQTQTKKDDDTQSTRPQATKHKLAAKI